jgi:hypothetical protein
MKRLVRSFALLGIAIYVALTFSGCASFRSAETKQAVPEPVGTYVVLVYELPFVYEKYRPRQEAFLSVIRDVIAPADYTNGPDSMTAIANMLVVSTTAENHMRLERFFDSIPDFPEQHPDTWSGPAKKKIKSE